MIRDDRFSFLAALFFAENSGPWITHWRRESRYLLKRIVAGLYCVHPRTGTGPVTVSCVSVAFRKASRPEPVTKNEARHCAIRRKSTNRLSKEIQYTRGSTKSLNERVFMVTKNKVMSFKVPFSNRVLQLTVIGIVVLISVYATVRRSSTPWGLGCGDERIDKPLLDDFDLTLTPCCTAAPPVSLPMLCTAL